MAQPSRSTRATSAASTRSASKRGATRAPKDGGDVPTFSPLDVLNEALERMPTAMASFSEESLLSVKHGATVQKYGVEFERTLWVAEDLQALTSLPGKWRKDQYRLEVRYDAAAASRDMLTSILVLARARDGRVVARVRCVPKDDGLATLDREKQAAAKRQYLERLAAERADAEVDRVEVLAGTGAARRQRAVQADVSRRRATQTRTRGKAPAPTPAAVTPTRSPATGSTARPKPKTKRAGPQGSGTARTTTPPQPAKRGQRAAPRVPSPPSPSSATRDALDAVASQFMAADPKRRGSP